jgi:hypothetical protein
MTTMMTTTATPTAMMRQMQQCGLESGDGPRMCQEPGKTDSSAELNEYVTMMTTTKTMTNLTIASFDSWRVIAARN